MRVRFPIAPFTTLLAGVVLVLGPTAAHADLSAGTQCATFDTPADGPTTSTTSSCQAAQSFPSQEFPGVLHEGGSSATSSVSTGVLQASASAWGRNGSADAFSFASLQSNLRITSTDESRLGELVWVTFGAHRVDAQFGRTATAPDLPPSEFPGPESSSAFTQLHYEFDLFTTQSGATHRFAWDDTGYVYEGAGTEYDREFHEVTGELAPFRLGLVLGELVSFNLALTARVDAFWTAQASIDASHSAYWGGITSVVDAAGRPVDYTVASGDSGDWGRSYVPVAAPVPEPATWLLGGLGVFGLMVQQRRRRLAP